MSGFNPILDSGDGSFKVQKFGTNLDIDTGTTPEDIWDGGGVYPFPTAAAATTVVSANAADTAAGTGAQQVTVEGLDSDYLFTTETIATNGGTVALSNQYNRIFRAYIGNVGSGGVNAGNITVQHGGTVLAQITAGKGQTLMAIYTIPADYPPLRLYNWYASVGRQAATSAALELRIRNFGKGWRVQHALEANAQGSGYFRHDFAVLNTYQPKTDIIVRCVNITTNSTQVSAGFDLKP